MNQKCKMFSQPLRNCDFQFFLMQKPRLLEGWNHNRTAHYEEIMDVKFTVKKKHLNLSCNNKKARKTVITVSFSSLLFVLNQLNILTQKKRHLMTSAIVARRFFKPKNRTEGQRLVSCQPIKLLTQLLKAKKIKNDRKRIRF